MGKNKNKTTRKINLDKSKNRLPEIKNDYHKAVIDEYFSNGFNLTQAVLKVKPGTNYHAAANIGRLIIDSPNNRKYVEAKRYDIGRETNVQAYQVVSELKALAFSDATRYLKLSEDQLKQLPPEERRAIKKINIKETTRRDRDGNTIIDKTILIELNDKLKALKELGKIAGIYEEDNRQKATKINLNKLDIHTLNNLLQVTEQTSKED